MSKRDELAEKYAKSAGDDCLCQRTNPGTPVGEHIFCFCGCDISDAFLAGYDAREAEVKRLREALEAACSCGRRHAGWCNQCKALAETEAGE